MYREHPICIWKAVTPEGERKALQKMTEAQLWEEYAKMVERESSKYNIRGSIQLLTYLDPFSQEKYYQTRKQPTTLVRKLAVSGRILS